MNIRIKVFSKRIDNFFPFSVRTEIKGKYYYLTLYSFENLLKVSFTAFLFSAIIMVSEPGRQSSCKGSDYLTFYIWVSVSLVLLLFVCLGGYQGYSFEFTFLDNCGSDDRPWTKTYKYTHTKEKEVRFLKILYLLLCKGAS